MLNFNKESTNAMNAIENLKDAYMAVIEERRQAILTIMSIYQLLNRGKYVVSGVTFEHPIQIEVISEDGEVSKETVTSIFNSDVCLLNTIEKDEIDLSCVSAKSLDAVKKAMKSGMWNVCLANSDEDFYDVSYNLLCRMIREEILKIYKWHSEQ